MTKQTITTLLIILGFLMFSAGPALAGLAGNALYFDGGDTVKIPYSTDFDNLASITVELWIQYDSPDNGFILDQLGPAPAHTREWALLTRDTKVQFYYRYPGISSATGSQAITDGVWHHIAITKQGRYLDMYVDGQHDISKTFNAGTVLNARLPIYWGSRGNFEQFLNGRMDEVCIWDYKRSTEEIAENYNKTIDPNSSGLLAYWNFDENPSDQNVFDLSPLNHHGTLGETSSVLTDDPTRIPSTAPIIPEPSTALLLVVGCTLLVARRGSVAIRSALRISANS